MKALVIAPQPFFTPRGTPLSVYYRTQVMAKLGVAADLLVYGEGDDVDIPGVRMVRIPRIRFLEPVKVGPSAAKALLDVLMVLWTLGLLLRRRYDYVHAHEEAVFWCRFLKPIFRFKLAYDMHSSLPQQLENFHFTKSKLLIGAFRWLEDAALRAADAVITICPDLRDYALSRRVEPERHFLIENSIFEDVRLKGARPYRCDAPPATDARISDGPRVVYAGTFEPYQGLEILVQAFANVTRQRPDAKLLMVGGTREQIDELQQLAHDSGLNGSCTFTGRVPKTQALRYLAGADVMVSPRREGTNTPLKVYEQLASGKPLVATNIWSHTQVLNDEVCFLVEPSVDSMAEGLLSAMNDREQAQQRAAAAQALYQREYSREAYEQKMRAFLGVLGWKGQT